MKKTYYLALFSALAAFGCLRVSAQNFWAFSSRPCVVVDASGNARAFDRANAATGGYYYVYGTDYGLSDMSISDAVGYNSITAEDVSGCRFLGWYTKKAGWGDALPTVATATDRLVSTNTLTLEDIEKAGLYGDRPTVVAKYISVFAVATGVSPSGSGEVTGDGTYDEGTTVTLKATAAPGYRLTCWKKGDEIVSTANNFSFTAGSDSAGTYTAVFAGAIYDVALKTCGGFGGQASVKAQYGSPMPPLDSLPSRTGWNFAGYYSSPTRTATQYYDSNGNAVRAWDSTGDGSLWEKWTPQLAPIRLSMTKGVAAICHRIGGGGWTTNTASATVERQVGLPVVAYGIPAVGHEITDYTVENPWKGKVLEGGQTFEPTVTPNTYTVRFHANTNSVSDTIDQVFVYGTPDELRANTFTCADSNFVGWAKTPDGVKAYDDGETVSNLTTVADGIVPLYAMWGELASIYAVAADCPTLELTVNNGAWCTVVSNAATAAEGPAAPGGNDQYVKLFLPPPATGNACISFKAPSAGKLTFYYKIFCETEFAGSFFVARKNGSEYSAHMTAAVSAWTQFAEIALDKDDLLELRFATTYNVGTYVLVDMIAFTATPPEE